MSRTTAPAVTTDSCQLVPTIFATAQTAMMGALIITCRPMAITIWIWVMSLVVRVIRLAAENFLTSPLPKAATLSNTFSRISKLKSAAIFAAK